MQTGAIIVAAGCSDQLRTFRPLMCISGKPMIRWLCDSLATARISPVVVVIGDHARQIEHCLEDTKAVVVLNRQFQQTDMLYSVQLGLTQLKRNCDGVLIIPADMPLILPSTFRTLKKAEAPVFLPVYQGQTGHPIGIGRELFESLLKYKGEDGLHGYLAQTDAEPVLIPVEDEGILLDVNTEEDYHQALNLAAKRAGKGKLHLSCDFQLSVDQQAMNRQTMYLLEMLEWTGSLQTASECLGLSYTQCWRQIKSMETELGFPIVESVAGGQRGGGTRLTEKGKLFLEAYQQFILAGEKMLEILFQEQFSQDFVHLLQK